MLRDFSAVISTIIVLVALKQYVGDSSVYWSPSSGAGLLWVGLTFGLIAAALKLAGCREPRLILAGITIGYLATGIGWAESISALYFFLSAYLAGNMTLRLIFRSSNENTVSAEVLVVGMGLFLFVFGILIHYHVNSRSLYLGLLSLPYVISSASRHISSDICLWFKYFSNFRRRTHAIPYWEWCVALAVVAYVACYAFFPSVNWDDNVLHLSIWTQLTHNGIVSFDVKSNIWAVAPFAVDLIHGVISVVAGNDARGAFDFALFVLLLSFVWRLSRVVIARHRDRLLVLVLFVSTPILALLLSSLQTDLFLALMVAIGSCIVAEPTLPVKPVQWVTILMIAAICVATKLPSSLIGAGLVIALAMKMQSDREGLPSLTRGECFKLVVLGLIASFVAFHSYILAYIVSGNPVLPLYNKLFKSSFYPLNNSLDTRFVTGASLRSFWNFFFQTSKHFESRDFVAGFQYLFLFPISVAALLALKAKRRIAVLLLIPVGIYGLAMFATVQYWRYFFAIMPVASVFLGSLLLLHKRRESHPQRHMLIRSVFVLFIGLNLFFLPGVSWYFDRSPISSFTEAGKRDTLRAQAPERLLNAALNQINPRAVVLFARSRPFGASFAGLPLVSDWYNPTVSQKVQSWAAKEDVAAMIQEKSIDFLYWDLATEFDSNDPYHSAVNEYLLNAALPEFQVGSIVAYRVGLKVDGFRNILDVDGFGDITKFTASEKLKISPEGIVDVGGAALLTRNLEIGAFRVARYSVDLRCPQAGAHFIAQLNWNIGPPYYRLVNCNKKDLHFSESILIPPGTTSAVLYLSARGDTMIGVSKVKVDVR